MYFQLVETERFQPRVKLMSTSAPPYHGVVELRHRREGLDGVRELRVRHQDVRWRSKLPNKTNKVIQIEAKKKNTVIYILFSNSKFDETFDETGVVVVVLSRSQG